MATAVPSATCRWTSCAAMNRSSKAWNARTTTLTTNRRSKVWNARRTTLSTVCRNRKMGIRAEGRQTWLPGLEPPPYLDGSLVGDFGFDPLELGEDPKNLRWYVQAELIHARFAMAGVAGILFTDLLRVAGLKNIPVWYEAGATKFEFASTETLFIVQLILMGFVETKRYMDFVDPGSQAAEGTFLGLEPALEGLEVGYPGGPLFDPVGLGLDITKLQLLKLKEIKNGRLAMVAMVGIVAQALITHTGPIDNLITHVLDPWHKTVIQTLANLGP